MTPIFLCYNEIMTGAINKAEQGRLSAKKGKADKKKTKDFFVAQGWMVVDIERAQMIFTPKGKFFVKRDTWGADLMMVRCVEGVWDFYFVQCKQEDKREFKKAREEFAKFPLPPFCKQVITYWLPKAKEPTIIE